jgi:hypothetical protein
MTELVRKPAPRVYVSGPVTNPHHATVVIRELERRGAHVVLDWPAEMARLAHVPPEGKARSHPWARWRMQALAAADAVLVLVGASCETRDREHGAAVLRFIAAEPVRIMTSGPLSSLGIWTGVGDHAVCDIAAVRSLTRDLRSVPAVAEAAIALFRAVATTDCYRRVEDHDHHIATSLSHDVQELEIRPGSPDRRACLGHVTSLMRLVQDASAGGSLGAERAEWGGPLISEIERLMRQDAFLDPHGRSLLED